LDAIVYLPENRHTARAGMPGDDIFHGTNYPLNLTVGQARIERQRYDPRVHL
jgi:hypothetical protein